MKIDDLFFGSHLDDSGLLSDVTKSGDKAGQELGRRMGLGMSAAIGVGAAVATAALNVVGNAAEGVVGGVEALVKAGIDGEESQKRLQASLEANVAGWNGSTDAINHHIQANLRLGFAEDEQRDSLSKIVGATHDVAKAYDVQNVAMDLARYKNISLGEATQALLTVNGGSYRLLKSLGIQLKSNATATEALAAVEKVASGQAEAFANTTEGKLAAAQDRLGATMEHLGTTVLPLVGNALQALSEAIDPTAKSFDDLQAAAAKGGLLNIGSAGSELAIFTDRAKEAGVSADVLYKKWQENGGNLDKAVHDLQTGVDIAFSDIGDHAGKMADDFGLGVRQINAGISDMNTHAGKLADDIHHDTRGIVDDFGTIGYAALSARDDMLTAATDEVHKYFDVVQAQDTLTAANAEISAARRILASKTASDKEKADATSTLHQATADQADALATIAAAGASTSKSFTKTRQGLQRDLALAKGAEKDAIQAELNQLALLDTAAAIATGKMLTLEQTIVATLAKGGYVQNIGSTPGKTSTPPAGGARATGGPVSPGVEYLVGERGPEVFMPKVPGYIIPTVVRDAGEAVVSGGMGGTGDVNFAAGAIQISGVGSDVSLPSAKRFGEAVMREVATGFRQQGARNGLHPRKV